MGKPSKKFDRALEELEDAPPGLMPDGKLNIVQAGDPPFEPEIVDDEGNPVSAEEGTEADRDEEA